MTSVTGILLAAGQSQRFGGNKLLYRLADGIPIVVHTARKLKAVLPDIIAVIGAGDQETAGLLDAERVQTVVNPHAEAGIGTSIACGVQATRQAHSWLIALADMPYLSRQTIRSVAAGIYNSNTICAPLYGDQRGHPVGFGKAYAHELMQLSADEGARRIVDANREYLELIKTHDHGVIADIDHPDDIRAAITNK